MCHLLRKGIYEKDCHQRKLTFGYKFKVTVVLTSIKSIYLPTADFTYSACMSFADMFRQLFFVHIQIS